jgi:hypothetical protein
MTLRTSIGIAIAATAWLTAAGWLMLAHRSESKPAAGHYPEAGPPLSGNEGPYLLDPPKAMNWILVIWISGAIYSNGMSDVARNNYPTQAACVADGSAAANQDAGIVAWGCIQGSAKGAPLGLKAERKR